MWHHVSVWVVPSISKDHSTFEPTCLRLAQGLLRYVRSGQTPFSSFLIWLSVGNCLLLGGARQGWELSELLWLSLGGHTLCLEFSSRSSLYFGRPASGSYGDARVSKELKLVWFGDFKIQFWILCFGIPGACLAFLRHTDARMWGLEDRERLSASPV